MRVLVVEPNLLWGPRLAKTLQSEGYEPTVVNSPVEGEFEAAIVNLSTPGVDWPVLIAGLHSRGMVILGHAGHKEKDLHSLGREAGCDLLATNSEITNKLPALMQRLSELRPGPVEL